MTKKIPIIVLMLVLLMLVLLMPVSILSDTVSDYTVTLPLVTNGDLDPLYRYAPVKPFWRRQAVTELRGEVSGIAIVTGLQTIVVRYYRNPKTLDVVWYLVAPDDDTWVAGELLRFGTFIWDEETALILIVPTTHRLTLCQADTLVAVNNGQVYGRGVFPPPCRNPLPPPPPWWKCLPTGNYFY